MKLLAIEMENFRPYRKRQKISFAPPSDRNVTILYGSNGAGKTTLLNAFTWALYGDISSDVEYKDRIINDTVWQTAPQGVRVGASVTIEFEHDGWVYGVRRSVYGTKSGTEQRLPVPDVTMWRRGSDGATKEVQSPSSEIDRILPKRLSKFFFVNGERMETMVRKDAYADILEAIKTLLGLEALDRGQKHLKDAAGKLRHKLRSGDEEDNRIRQLNEELDAINEELQDKSTRRDEFVAEEQFLGEEIDAIDVLLSSMADARELQERRRSLTEQRDRAVQDRRQQETQLEKTVGMDGYLAFLGELPNLVVAASDNLRERGELPAPLKRTFIEDLLDRGHCICGHDLPEGSPERAALEDWRARAGFADVEAAWSSLRGTIVTFQEQRTTLLRNLEAAHSGAAQAAAEERRLNGALDEVSAQLKDMPQESISELEARRRDYSQRLGDVKLELGALKDRLQRLDESRTAKEKALDQLQVKGDVNERTKRRMVLIKEVEGAITQIRELAAEGARRRLEERLRNIYIPISIKQFEPRITAGFQLEYGRTVDGNFIPEGKSTGENLLLALSFVAAIAAECRAVAEEGNPLFGGVSGEFPVVMDAVFGNLDVDYRRQVAQFLPQMTSQVVVLTSKGQIQGVVEERLQPRAGRQYVITTHTTKTDVKDVTERISVGGRDYAYQILGSEWNGAEMVEAHE